MSSYKLYLAPMSVLPFCRNFINAFVNEKTEKYKETYKVIMNTISLIIRNLF